jgi:hypothetical protein
VIKPEDLTDEMIRELACGADRRLRALCKVALNDAPTYLRASVVRDARKRLAELISDSRRKGR